MANAARASLASVCSVRSALPPLAAEDVGSRNRFAELLRHALLVAALTALVSLRPAEAQQHLSAVARALDQLARACARAFCARMHGVARVGRRRLSLRHHLIEVAFACRTARVKYLYTCLMCGRDGSYGFSICHV